MKKLPIGIQSFEEIITDEYLYVDKTRYLWDIIKQGKVFFLSRPRRFGKSLTLSTFKAIFEGKKELFDGLQAQEYMNSPKAKVYPILHFDMSIVNARNGAEGLERSISAEVAYQAKQFDADVQGMPSGDALKFALREISSRHGRVVVLIDEYDKPILDYVSDHKQADAMRKVLRSFYSVLKGCDEYLRFLFITGISKFTKVGVFSALNNLNDISFDEKYAPMLGYTQNELEHYFAGYILETSETMHLSKEELLARIKEYYNGFSFDGEHFVYNPFSILNFFSKCKFRNYWFESASPSFIADYAKYHRLNMNDYRGIPVDISFTSTTEIENADPASFLYQAGYLSVRERQGNYYILDYPNEEVLKSVSVLFLKYIYGLREESPRLMMTLESSLESGDVESLMAAFDRVLAAIPYNLFEKTEKYYHSVFLVLLWASGAGARGEDPSRLGRADIVIEWKDRVYILELKLAQDAEDDNSRSIAAAEKALKQIEERDYHGQYMDGRHITLIGIGIDAGKRKIGGYMVK